MNAPTGPYNQQYLDGRRVGMTGGHRDKNPFFAQTMGEGGKPDSHEVWQAKYDIWRQGWTEGNEIFQRDGIPK